MIENWKPIPGYDGVYWVSNLGRVKSLKHDKERIFKPGKDGGGYLQVCLRKDGKAKKFKVHRLVASAFIPNPNNLPQVNHKDENKLNNCVENLEWCDAEYNVNYGTRNKKVSNGMRCRWGKTTNLPGIKDEEKFLTYLKEHRIVHKNYGDNYYLKNRNNGNHKGTIQVAGAMGKGNHQRLQK